METDLERRAEQIFDQTLDVPTADRRAAAIAACRGDAALLVCVQALLTAHQADGFLADTAPFGAAPTSDTAAIGEGPGSWIGRYKLLEQIGEGGFGVVFMAEQERPVRRRVALKVIKLGMDTKEVVARFEAERQALALMDHPNIARVFDAGATDTGRPYFVMELVRGSPITEYADHMKMSTRERVALAVQVARAVQHAHSKGVIHRDLKPSNVLVTVADDKPIPKVIDFGIAKATQSRLTDRTLFTQFRQMIGTPQYMSPEQADSNGTDVDTRTDIYSLGVLIYELLVGTTPMDARQLRSAAHEAMRKMICDTDVPRPATRLHTLAAADQSNIAARRSTDVKKLSESIRGELDWIVMKALEKDRTRRYETAAALADDLNRYVTGEAVLAGPVSGTYRLKKVLKKYKAAAITGGVIAACLLLGIAGTTWGLVQAERQRSKAETNAAQAVHAERQATVQATAAETARSQADQARHDAERQAEIATRAAARSDAQYLLGGGLLQDALVRATDAWKLGGLWEDGFTLDRIRAAARSHWQLAATYPVNGKTVGCLCQHSGASVLILADDNGLTAYSVARSQPIGHATSPSEVMSLIVDPDGNAVTSFRRDGVDRLSLPDLRLLATHPLAFVLKSVDASAGGVLIVDNDGNCHVFSPTDLTEVDTLVWKQQSWEPNRVLPSKAVISPSGRRILLRTDWWSKLLFWDRDLQGQNKLRHTTSNQVDQLQFVTDDAYATWQELDVTGGAGGRFEIRPVIPVADADTSGNGAPASAAIRPLNRNVPNDTLKKSVALEAWVDAQSREVRYTLIGSVGYSIGNSTAPSGAPVADDFYFEEGDTVSVAGSSAESDRYANLAPTEIAKPTYLCGSFRNGLLALQHGDQVLVYNRAMESATLEMDDFSAAICRAGLLRVVSEKYEPRNLALTPFDSDRPLVNYPIQWGQSSGSTPHLKSWALGATTDGSTVVVIGQESSGGNTVESDFGTSHAMVYHITGGLPAAATTLPLSANFDLQSSPVENWNARSVAIEPAGRVMFWLTTSNGARRYSLLDGKMLGILPLSPVTRASTDGRFAVGINPDDGSLSVFDIATGNRIVSIPGHAKATSVCVSNDDNQVLVGDGQQLQTYALPGGNLLASVPTALVPMAAIAAGKAEDRFLAFRPDEPGAVFGDIVIADRACHVAAVLARSGASKYPAYFSPDGHAIAVVQSRWRSAVYRSLSPDQLTAALSSSAGNGDAVADQAAMPLRQLASATSRPAGDVVDATDIKALANHLGINVVVRGTVKVVDWAGGRNWVNLRFDDQDQREFTGFVSAGGLKRFRKISDDNFLSGLAGKKIEMKGSVVRYTFAKSGDSILELIINDPAQIKVLPEQP